MTVDELARKAGTTTRNVRSYQTRGLLPPPEVIGRTGYYDESHLVRLGYIDRLQQRGFSLAAIRDLLAAWDEGRTLDDVLGFEEALNAPWSDEKPRQFTRDELDQLFPEAAGDDQFLRRALDVGLLTEKDGAYEAPSPELVRVGAGLVRAGVPLDATIDEYEWLSNNMRRVAEHFVKLFEDHVWEPFVQAGFPAERLPEVTAALQRVRPLASASVVAELARAMERAVADSTARQTARFVQQPPRG